MTSAAEMTRAGLDRRSAKFKSSDLAPMVGTRRSPICTPSGRTISGPLDALPYRIVGAPDRSTYGVQIGDRLVPTIGAKSLLLNFAERLSDPARVISVADVIAGTVPKKKDSMHKIVLVGVVDSTLW